MATPEQFKQFESKVREAVRLLDVARSYVSDDPDIAHLVDPEIKSLRSILARADDI